MKMQNISLNDKEKRISLLVITGFFLAFNMIMLLKQGFPCGVGDLAIRWQELMCIQSGVDPIGTTYLPEIGEKKLISNLLVR